MEFCARKMFLGFFRNPFVIGGTTALGILAGFLGATYADQIKATLSEIISKVGMEGLPVSGAELFWISLALFSFGFAASQWGQTEHAEDNQAALRIQTDKLLRGSENLEQAIRTLPPKGFLNEFESLYKLASEAYEEGMRHGNVVEDVEIAIRVVLSAIASLAHFFDAKPKGRIYAANIMLARIPAELSKPECDALEKKLVFYDKSSDIKKLAAVLEVCPHLSTTTAVEGANPDSSLPNIALPVPQPPYIEIEHKILYNVLPGAPFAFYSKRPAGYENTASLVEWCERNGNYAPSMLQELKTYFSESPEKSIVSFLSVPMGNEKQTIGILNIHADREGVLGDDGVQLFVPLLSPYIILLCALAKRREELLIV